jgi:hypothetical protein
MIIGKWVALAPLLLNLTSACGSSVDQEESASSLRSDTIPAWLLARQAEQRTRAGSSAVLHDFGFADRLDASGITFRNRIVDDAGKNYKRVHYDHGTGVAAADVDGDHRVDLYFVSQLGTGELWKNQGGGRFLAWTDSAGLRMPDAIAVGASFADIDNDGDPDLYVTTVRHGNRLFENRGGGRFREITAAAGVGYLGHSSGAIFFDYDGDGLLDLFLTNVGVYTSAAQGAGGFYIGLEDAFRGHLHPDRAEASILYRNLGGNRFRDVSAETGLVDRSWSGDATILDVNDDGRPDLYLPNMQGANHLWRNEGGRRFRDVTAATFPSTPWGAMGVTSFDWNGDGRPDLLVTDMHSDMFANIEPEDRVGEDRKADSARIPADFFAAGKTGLIFGNALFTNRGDGRFEDESDAAGAENYWPWGPSVGDLNADGWEDVFIASSMNFPHRYAVNAVLLNDSGRRFLRSEFLLGIEPRKGGVTEQPWFTLECGGADRENSFCRACMRPGATAPECRHRDGQGRLTMMGAVGTRSAVLVDLDGDGDQDIVTNEFNGPPQLLLSDLAGRHPVHSLSIRLRGTASNRQGIGARVTVVLPDGRRLVRTVDGKSGYLSQSDLPLYIGLGAVTRADTVEVRWPSGKRQRVPGPHPAGQTLEIVER